MNALSFRYSSFDTDQVFCHYSFYAAWSKELGEHHKKVNQELNLFGHQVYLTRLQVNDKINKKTDFAHKLVFCTVQDLCVVAV